MFKKVLIANRGEIALRVLRACKELGVATVAVHSTADAESLHVRFADEAICIGPPQSRDSYLNPRALLAAADVTGADALHPGYGFLSENAEFAAMVEKMGLKFIGPRPEMIRLMGNKVAAREAAEQAGLPLLPGARGKLADAEEAERIAEQVGYPVILKAAAGGGGRGMKICRDRSQIRQLFETASTEALAAFGDGSMYLERYVEMPRHIELQIVADEHGNIIHLGERECSVQRRHQKLIEESPSPAVTPELRREMGEVALKAMRKIGYNNVGTIEFLMDEKGRYYFMEMNTRIQVEHPVTEQVYGLDLLREQIRLAAGEKLERSQASVVPQAHSIECRVNAEDPVTFAPSPGRITGYHQPGGYGVRVDTMAYEQYKVQPYYDSLVAKLIVTGANREIALRRAMRALNEYVIEGIKTNIPFHKRVLTFPAFTAGQYDTRIVEQILNPPAPEETPASKVAGA
ncbi:acetyl-CoA carboxylase, biotin carboxylase [Anaeromyxobacter sp. K]|uniref:Biotin carboxylase n=1 Tax=Anaeromyxobacter dehalogenans (strain ATCC BAA-258 / DSM 21875 / 2CP-1) TaxID=455488 RepID=B8JD13_ANAD2|nr:MULTISPECIES: acetyl-CoA carboxylase biotin carboxylase subunit [Anaeromyxobacter]ACG71923.1 acetyl-CoA carboxylase, biotin carboxylase [Anaeromyxobacter sp. K]ACL64041.1 acetyl-CoA carboxylase, biotin carboxylase [Anaeromyxobacter dehalogenans 2CP-1]